MPSAAGVSTIRPTGDRSASFASSMPAAEPRVLISRDTRSRYGSGDLRIYVATCPTVFRKGIDGLALLVQETMGPEPFSGAAFVFRAKRDDRIKVLMWDGTGLVLIYKRIEGAGFNWPKLSDGTMTLTKAQFEALFEGIDWRRVAFAPVHRPALFQSQHADPRAAI